MDQSIIEITVGTASRSRTSSSSRRRSPPRTRSISEYGMICRSKISSERYFGRRSVAIIEVHYNLKLSDKCDT